MFIDRDVRAGQSYLYRVARTGNEHATDQIASVSGLPSGWVETSYGEHHPAGNTNVLESSFIMQAYGTHPFGHSDELHFVHTKASGNGILTARFSPLLASQAATTGLMLRAEDTADAPMIALSISADHAGERPTWILTLLSRESTGEAVRTLIISPLLSPLVTYGRITQPIWLRLSRKADELRAHISQDGLTWTDVGKTSVTKEQMLSGCFACSGMGAIPAQITFEQISWQDTGMGRPHQHPRT
jgi:hypothetical protein